MFFTMCNRDIYAEIPTNLKDLMSGGFSREVVGNDTHLNIGGARLLISKL